MLTHLKPCLLAFCRGIDTINKYLGYLAAFSMLVVVLIGSANAVLRYAGSHFHRQLTSNAMVELQWYLFGLIFFLGASWTLRNNGHVRVDVLYDRLQPPARRWINMLGHALLLMPFCVMMVWVSIEPVAFSWEKWEQSGDPGGLPRYPIKTLVPLGFILLGLQSFSEFCRELFRPPEKPGTDGPASPEVQF